MSALLTEKVGTLATTPFPELLASALDEQLTGTLVLEEPGGPRHGLYFEAGEPSRAKVASAGIHLGEVLVAQGTISEELRRATLERALRSGVLHGQLLLENGFVSEHALAGGLKEQLARQVVWLFTQPRATKYGYFDGVNFLAHWGAVAPRVDALEVLWRGIRDEARSSDIAGGLARFVGLRLELRSDLLPGHFDFMGDERRVVERLAEKPHRVAELVAGEPGHEALVERVLFFLVLTRAVKLAFSTPPPAGVERRSTPPSLIPPSGIPSSRGDARRITPDPAMRAAHDAARIAAAGAADRDSAPDLAFHRAETLLARGKLEEARAEVKTALAEDPTRPEHIALGAWLEALGKNPDPRRLFSQVERALKTGESNVKAQWYAGLTLKQLGRHGGALRAFRFVAESDPRHIDAAREVRLYEQQFKSGQKGRTSPSLAPSAPWSRLFGRRS